jgi:hypothetical protein
MGARGAVFSDSAALLQATVGKIEDDDDDEDDGENTEGAAFQLFGFLPDRPSPLPTPIVLVLVLVLVLDFPYRVGDNRITARAYWINREKLARRAGENEWGTGALFFRIPRLCCRPRLESRERRRERAG